jgi:VWFA-related protein
MFLMGMLFILLLATVALAQETPVFRAGVSLVRVDVQVVEGKRILNDLTKDDFLILDEGKPQEIVYFGHEAEPLSVLLLLDVSGSMHRRLEEMAAASRQALQSLKPGDEVGVMLFSRRTAVRQDFTPNFAEVSKQISEAVHEQSLGSGTRINAAVLDAAAYARRQLEGKPGRRAIVILTDNSGLNYQIPNENVVQALYEADTVFNAIVVGKAKPPEPPKRGAYVNPDFTPSDVFLLARETGGEVLRAEKAGEPFREMMERIRTRYSLHYRPPEGPPGSFRRIEVELTPPARKAHPRAEIKARSGYYIPR